MTQFQKHDIVEFSNAFQTVRCTVDSVQPNGMVLVIRPAGTPLTIAADRLTLIEAATAPAAAKHPAAPVATPQAPRYECLSCGHLHSRFQCPACGADDKLDYVAPIPADEQAKFVAAQTRKSRLQQIVNHVLRDGQLILTLQMPIEKIYVERVYGVLVFLALDGDTIYAYDSTANDNTSAAATLTDAALTVEIRALAIAAQKS